MEAWIQAEIMPFIKKHQNFHSFEHRKVPSLLKKRIEPKERPYGL
jgi:hypothetical protein